MFVFLYGILVLAFLIAVVVFGDSPSFRNTPLQKLHRWLLWCNSRVFHYATVNPISYAILRWTVPLFYCTILTVSVAQFFTHVYPKLDVRRSHGHFLYILFSLASLVLTTEFLTFSDPGYATEETVDANLRKYSENGLIFFANKTCRTCHLPKPARSKHCSTCNRCVYVYDHHCVFVNNCVGQDNYRWFIAFLLSNINVMVYGGYLCWTLLNKEWEYGWWHTITRTTQANKVAGILSILAGIFAIVVAAFTALHFRYMYLGVTTNEADKWGEIEHLVSLGVLFYVEDLGVFVEKAATRDDNGDYVEVYISLDDQQILFSEEESGAHSVRKISSMTTDLDNMYDRGFAANVKSRLFSQ